MNSKLISCLSLTSLTLLACGRGCTRDEDILPPIPTPIGTTAVPKPVPTLEPTIEIKTFIVPERINVNEPFQVRAYVSAMEILEVYADDYRLGYMGWDSTCKCKFLVVKLNTPGTRKIRFLAGITEVSSQNVVVEEVK